MSMDVDPRAPCPHPPGSRGKVAVLEARAALRLPLFRPDDAGDPEDVPTFLNVWRELQRTA